MAVEKYCLKKKRFLKTRGWISGSWKTLSQTPEKGTCLTETKVCILPKGNKFKLDLDVGIVRKLFALERGGKKSWLRSLESRISSLRIQFLLIFGESSIKSLGVLKVFCFICMFRSSLVVHLSLWSTRDTSISLHQQVGSCCGCGHRENGTKVLRQKSIFDSVQMQVDYVL